MCIALIFLFILSKNADCTMLTVLLAELRGVEKAHEETAPAPQPEASEEAAPAAAADETNGPTPEEEAEAEAKVSLHTLTSQS